MAPDADGAAHSPRLDLDYEPSRRDVLRAAGATGAAAAIASTPTLAQDNSTNTSDGEDINYLSTGASIGLSPGMSALSYFTTGSFDWISAWGDQPQDDWEQKYEYEQRLDIYQEAYNFVQFTKRQLASIEGQGNSLSRWVVGDALKEVYRQAEDDVDLSTAISEGQAVVDEQFESPYQKVLDHWEQTSIALKGWYDYLNQMESELSDSTTVSYSMIPHDVFGDYVGDEDGIWQWAEHQYQTPNGSRTIQSPAPGADPVPVISQMTAMVLPQEVHTPRSHDHDTTDDARYWIHDSTDDMLGTIYTELDNGWTYRDDIGSASTISAGAFETEEGDGSTTSNTISNAVRIMPPDPNDFNVDPEDVEDISDHEWIHLLSLHRWLDIIDILADRRQNARDTVETWCNSNYEDLRQNTDQYDIEDMSTAPALQDAAENAENPAEAALLMYSMEIPTNLENDVRLKFPNVTDENGNPVQASGYLGVTNPPSDGLPVGEVIDPTEHDGEIYFAHDVSDVPIAGVEETGNMTDGNTTDGNTTDGEAEATATATHTQLTAEFEIIDTSDGGDFVQFDSRETVDPDYDWQQVKELLEEQNQARTDAGEQTMETAPDGSSGPIIPDDFDLGIDSPLAGLAIIGATVVAVLAAVSNLLPGN